MQFKPMDAAATIWTAFKGDTLYYSIVETGGSYKAHVHEYGEEQKQIGRGSFQQCEYHCESHVKKIEQQTDM